MNKVSRPTSKRAIRMDRQVSNNLIRNEHIELFVTQCLLHPDVVRGEKTLLVSSINNCLLVAE